MKYVISLILVLASGMLAAMACFRKKSGFGARLSHAGFALVLLGFCCSFLAEIKSSFVVYGNEKTKIREIYDGNGGLRDLGFYFVLDGISPGVNAPCAELSFEHDDGTGANAIVRVNRPARHGGWHFYLSDYDMVSSDFVKLTVRKDPGRVPVFTGMAILMLGIACAAMEKKS